MKQKVIFYHAGCPVCLDAESIVVKVIDKSRYEIEIVHLADQPARISEAELSGVRSVPALIMDDEVLHINFGASIAEVKAGL